MNKLLLCCLLLIGQCNAMKLPDNALMLPGSLKGASVYHDQDGFTIEKDDITHHVKNYNVDAGVRYVSQSDLVKVLTAGTYLKVNQYGNSDDSVTINMCSRLKGGGPMGAWLGGWVGFLGVNAIAHGFYFAASTVANCIVPFSGPVVYATLDKACFLPVQIASKAAGCGLSIICGTFSGPV